jgi:hypothetical protein
MKGWRLAGDDKYLNASFSAAELPPTRAVVRPWRTRQGIICRDDQEEDPIGAHGAVAIPRQAVADLPYCAIPPPARTLGATGSIHSTFDRFLIRQG